MSGTSYKGKIGEEDLALAGAGLASTFARETSTGGSLSLYRFGSPDGKIRRWKGIHWISTATTITDHSAASDGSLASVVSELAATLGVIEAPPNRTYSITAADVTLNAATALRVHHGAVFSMATGRTLTINGPFLDPGPVQCFSRTGTGTVAFGAGSTPYIRPEWFGARSAVAATATAAMQWAAAVAIASSVPIQFGRGTFAFSSMTTFSNTDPDGLIVRGAGWDTIIKADSSFSETPVAGDDYAALFKFTLDDGNFCGLVLEDLAFNLNGRDVSAIWGYNGAQRAQLSNLYVSNGSASAEANPYIVLDADFNTVGLDNVVIKGAGTSYGVGIHCDTQSATVRDCSVINIKTALSLESGVSNFALLESRLEDVGYGLLVNAQNILGVHVGGTRFEDCALGGIVASGLSSTYRIEKLVIDGGCYFSYSDQAGSRIGITVSNVRQLSIRDNIFFNSAASLTDIPLSLGSNITGVELSGNQSYNWSKTIGNGTNYFPIADTEAVASIERSLSTAVGRPYVASGRATLNGGTPATVTVTLPDEMKDALYEISLVSTGNETVRWGSLTTTSFVVTSSLNGSTGTVGWILVHQ